MRVIISGSRSFSHPRDYELLDSAMREFGIRPTVIICGMAKHGIDRHAVRWAAENKIGLEPYRARWDFGRWAGMQHNSDMIDTGQALVAVWDGESKGTLDAIKKARKRGLLVHVKEVVL